MVRSHTEKPRSTSRILKAPFPGPFLLVAMLPDLEHLIHLQALETRIDRARTTIAATPGRLEALDGRLTALQDVLAAAEQRLADNHTARRALEKDLAAAQAQLARFKDQLMAVKTNKEYQAMQKEIATAEHETRSVEDRILENLLAGDERAAEVQRAEEGLSAERTAIEEERRVLEAEGQDLERDIAQGLAERQHVVSKVDPGTLALYEQVARARRGVGVAEARAGLCGICNVRLRPQMFNEIRRNERVIQCESCQRILYFAPAAVDERQPAEPRNAE